jgi:hypothetical protein
LLTGQAFLIDCTPKVALLPVYLDEYFVDKECIAVTSMLLFLSMCINRTEFITPEPIFLAANGNTSLSEQVFNIAVTKIESVVKPGCVTDDLGREAVTFACVHIMILPVLGS